MPSRRQLSPIGKTKRSIKPRTALQRQMVAQRERDYASTESRAQMLEQHFRAAAPAAPAVPDDPADAPIDEWMDDADVVPGDAPQPDGLGEAAPNTNETLQFYIDELNRNRKMTKRLEHENQRIAESHIMLPHFLACSERTLDWGHQETWNQDYKVPCDCGNLRKRNVDLVDVFSKWPGIRYCGQVILTLNLSFSHQLLLI